MRLIDKEALIEWLTTETGFKTNCEDCICIDCLDCIVEEAIKNAPTIEAKPVVHAHWETVYVSCVGATEDDYEEEAYKCSNCKRTVEVDTPYCAFCGAQMDEGVKIPVISMEDVPKIAKEMEK